MIFLQSGYELPWPPMLPHPPELVSSTTKDLSPEVPRKSSVGGPSAKRRLKFNSPTKVKVIKQLQFA